VFTHVIDVCIRGYDRGRPDDFYTGQPLIRSTQAILRNHRSAPEERQQGDGDNPRFGG